MNVKIHHLLLRLSMHVGIMAVVVSVSVMSVSVVSESVSVPTKMPMIVSVMAAAPVIERHMKVLMLLGPVPPFDCHVLRRLCL